MSDTPRTVRLRSGIETINAITGETAPTYSEYVLLEDYQRDLAAANDRIKALEAVHKGTEQSETPPKRVALPNFGAIDYWEDRARKAEAERDALKADAERYRYLRQVDRCMEWENLLMIRPITRTEDIDAAIDAARKP